MKIRYLIVLFAPLLLFSQIRYSGKVVPKYLFKLSDGAEISLPFRLAEFQLDYSIGDFEFKTNSALETSWSNKSAEIDLREIYLVWYPAIGELKFGKIIHTWGAVDGNNPTDNINPYNYYYLFSTGADRKIGVLAGSAKLFWNNFNAEFIVVPEHTPNKFPLGEKDFPIQFPKIDRFAKIIENELMFGLRFQSEFNFGDFSISYIDGHDNNFSWLRITDLNGGIGQIVDAFGFRKTKMYGADMVTFIHDFTIRSEAGYFQTNNKQYLEYELGKDSFDPPYPQSYVDDQANSMEKSNFNKRFSSYWTPEIFVDYLQYVFQLEYSGFSNFIIGMQYLKTDIIDISNNYDEYMKMMQREMVNFKPGMGTPFAAFTNSAVIINGFTTFYDSRIDIETLTLINLEETGFLIGANCGYSPLENWELNFGIKKFVGDSDNPANRFSQMEDFSHILIGIDYSF